MKKLRVALTLLLMTTNGFAASEGFYVGAQLGYAKVKDDARQVFVAANSAQLTTATASNASGFSPRIYAGYQINSYFGVEAGGAFYPTVDYDTAVATCKKPKRRLSAFDLSGKGTWDFGSSGFNVYAKAGLAYVTVEDTNNMDIETPLKDCSQSGKSKKIRPQLGIGAGYNVSGNTTIDLSMNRIFKGSNFPAMDLVALGFTYNFADPSCGQFLC